MKTKNISLFLILASLLMACGAPAPTAAEPVAITQGYWDALNAKNIDGAMALVADDVQISGGPDGVSVKAGLSTFLSSETKRGVTFEISDLKMASGDTVTFNLEVYENGALLTSGAGEFQVKDGKIIVMKFPG
jgi:hypothetical protein